MPGLRTTVRQHPTKKVIDQATQEIIDCLLLERISLAGIARAVQVPGAAILSELPEHQANHHNVDHPLVILR